MVFQDIPLYSIFVLKGHLLAEAYVYVFKNDYLFAAPCVCCADISASGATLFTQTPIGRVMVPGSRLFKAECATWGGPWVREQNFLGHNELQCLLN